jgi:hypothetical protein
VLYEHTSPRLFPSVTVELPMSCAGELVTTLPAARRALLRVARLALSLGIISASLQLAAQNVPAQAPAAPPAAQQPPPSPAQQPATESQLQAGTASGLTTDARLQNLLADHEYAEVAAQISQLPPEQAQFYRGILANRSNHLEQSVQLLEPLVDSVSQSGNSAHEKELRRVLAEDYLRLGDWQKAKEAYQALEVRLKDKLTPDEQDELELPVKLLPLAAGNPRMTIEPGDPFKLQVTGNPLGLVDIPVFVDARSRNWMLDPTLPFNLIDRSTAKEVGLKLSDANATITTLTGRPIQVRAAVIPRFTVGGRLTLRDMTVFVYDDKDYFFPSTSYQVEGVLGYPALAAMGSLTVNSDNTVFIRPAKQIAPPVKDDLLTGGTPFYLDGEQVIVALGRAQPAAGESARENTAAGQGSEAAAQPSAADAAGERMFAVDAGSQQTYLTSRYFDEHAADFNSQKMQMISMLGGQSPQPAYTAENVPLLVGATPVTFRLIRVLTQPLGSAALDDVYGVLGADALGQLKSYTFDYRTMRFAVTTE